MGISAHNARVLLDCRRRGMSFGRTLMIGRQNVYVSRPEFRKLVRAAGLAGEPGLADAVTRSGEFAEPLFRALGAESVESLDGSGFEGATHVHDLNQPVPRAWHGCYDLVYDGGSLEHVFDFPTAIASCLRMVKVGGHLVLHTPANNHLGHGFHQFSPELWFRLLVPANGFEMRRVLAVELGWRTRWWEVIDPEQVGRRGELSNRAPVLLHVDARKVSETPDRLAPVQQSDYQTRWQTHRQTGADVPHLADHHRGVDPRLRRFLLERCPGVTRWLERVVSVYLQPGAGFGNRANYRRLRW